MCKLISSGTRIWEGGGGGGGIVNDECLQHGSVTLRASLWFHSLQSIPLVRQSLIAALQVQRQPPQLLTREHTIIHNFVGATNVFIPPYPLD